MIDLREYANTVLREHAEAIAKNANENDPQKILDNLNAGIKGGLEKAKQSVNEAL